MDVLKSDDFLVANKDPLLPCVNSVSEDSLFRDSLSSRIKVEIKEEVDDWELSPIQEYGANSFVHNPLENADLEIGPSASWNEFYQSLREETSIQEIIIPNNTSDTLGPILVENNGERKRYQRFREKKFVCDECDRCFTLKQNVQQHIMIYHVNGEKQLQTKRRKRFKCLKCDQVFKTLEQAQRHDMTKHGMKASGVRVFKCEQCPKVYPTSSSLKEHITIFHLKERPFECAECGIRFGRKGGLRRHMQMVHECQLYMCPFDGCTHPGYKCTKALAAHIRSVHTKDRPFQCMLCERRFVRKNDLKTHEMTHQATAAFKCPDCNKEFKRLAGLRAHKKRCHEGMKKEEEDEENQIKKEVKDEDNECEEKMIKEEPVVECTKTIKLEEPLSP